MKIHLSRFRIALALAIAALALSLFPATSYANSSDAWPPYPGYGSSYGCVHVVHYGETMNGIAWSYGTSVSNLMQANGILYPNRIYAGMSMAVPCGSAGYGNSMPYSNQYRTPYSNQYFAPYSNPYQMPYSNQCVAAYYPVQFGDDLYRIALRYGVNMNTLAYANGLVNPNLIYAGMRLIIPCSMGYSQQPYSAPMYSQPYPAPGYPPQPYSTPAAPPAPYATPMPNMTPIPNATPIPMSTPPASGQVTIIMRNISFNSSLMTIRVGQTVTWRNDDSVPHTTTSGSCPNGTCAPMPGWDSGTLNPGQSFSQQFTTAGTFTYYCRIHGAMMQGTIVVTP